jgi:cobalt-precorrin-5B (C1)-methyltransferase
VHSLEKGDGEGAEAWVIKDGGDDPDVTSGLAIVASVRLLDEERIEIRGGEGVGVVTKKGLPVPVGEPAINPGRGRCWCRTSPPNSDRGAARW